MSRRWASPEMSEANDAGSRAELCAELSSVLKDVAKVKHWADNLCLKNTSRGVSRVMSGPRCFYNLGSRRRVLGEPFAECLVQSVSTLQC